MHGAPCGDGLAVAGDFEVVSAHPGRREAARSGFLAA